VVEEEDEEEPWYMRPYGLTILLVLALLVVGGTLAVAFGGAEHRGLASWLIVPTAAVVLPPLTWIAISMMRRLFGNESRQLRWDIPWTATTIVFGLAAAWIISAIILTGVEYPRMVPDAIFYQDLSGVGTFLAAAAAYLAVWTARRSKQNPKTSSRDAGRTEAELRYEFLSEVRHGLVLNTLDEEKIKQLEGMARALNAPQAASSLKNMTPSPPGDDETPSVPSHA
jgi:lysylphosphatidylglycerol synthetase-like protein (DUF2156 family)